MSITRVLQPHVCCLGNPVAGNPTQFVMYRAARACGVDWRFFTSQVEVDQFEVAFRGVQALGLDGVALFDPFQSVVIPLLDSVTESALCLGRVNVARSDGNSWLGDNTLGTAIFQCIEAKQKSAANESAVLVLNCEPIARVVRLATSKKVVEVISITSDTAPVAVRDATANDLQNGELLPKMPDDQPETSDAFPSATIESAEELDTQIGTLIVSEFPTPTELRKLNSVRWSPSARCIVTGYRSEKQMRSFREWTASNRIELVEHVEMLAYQVAADFQFWTGVCPSVELIRDSLEEYLQW